MLARLFTKRVLSAVVAVFAFGAVMAAGVPTAGAITDEDQHFIDFVEELEIPMNSPDETIQVGREVCTPLPPAKSSPQGRCAGWWAH